MKKIIRKVTMERFDEIYKTIPFPQVTIERLDFERNRIRAHNYKGVVVYESVVPFNKATEYLQDATYQMIINL